jgi:membrane protease YdiL (CAAX protease family)
MGAIQKVEAERTSRFVLFMVLLAGGLLVFLPAITFSAEISPQFRGSTAVVLLGITILTRLNQRYKVYWQLPMTLFIAALSLLVTSLFGDWLLDLWGLTLNSAAGIAVAKLSDAIPIVVVILIVNRIFGFDLGSIYVQKGHLKRGLAIGLGGFAVFSVLTFFQSKEQGIEIAQIVPVIPWILLFVLANGFMEELLFRGLFLKRYEPFLGGQLSVLVTALVFTAVHMQVGYVQDLWGFLVLVFLLALAWGELMRNTNSLIGSGLFHAGADLLIITGVLASFGANLP